MQVENTKHALEHVSVRTRDLNNKRQKYRFVYMKSKNVNKDFGGRVYVVVAVT